METTQLNLATATLFIRMEMVVKGDGKCKIFKVKD